MNTYQYNLDVLVGSEGDVWFDVTKVNLLDINVLEYDEKRGNYQRISNLPPIKKVVNVIDGSISMITRSGSYIIIEISSSDNYEIRETPHIIDAYMLTDRIMTYLTDESEARMTNNLSHIVAIEGDDTIIDKSLLKDTISIRPMKLIHYNRPQRDQFHQSQFEVGELVYPLEINALFLHIRGFDVIITPHSHDGWFNDKTLKTFIHQDRLIKIIDISLDVILTKKSIMSVSMDDEKLYDTGLAIAVIETTPVNVTNIVEACRVNSEACILANNMIVKPDGTPIIRDVSRVIKFINYPSSQLFITNSGDELYELKEDRLEKLDVPIVLA